MIGCSRRSSTSHQIRPSNFAAKGRAAAGAPVSNAAWSSYRRQILAAPMVSFGFSRNEWLAYQMGRRVSEALDRAPEMGWHVDQPSCRPPSVGWWLGDHLHRIHLTLKQRHWELRPVQQRKQSHTYDPAVGGTRKHLHRRRKRKPHLFLVRERLQPSVECIDRPIWAALRCKRHRHDESNRKRNRGVHCQ
ncbi:hypothetical protein XAC3810_210025 [Xanthomonas citri pv. citri]|uniref:Uncharacterized protein n=1 Tax=Xanthomonas citri pv. citri TaxID=611301 RepID=A0A0U5BPS0_XANCI|nr:hypothetical protein XAC9322_190024 [Xanthomonas citri pv. citri]CEE20372.1 hypothetical protein XAC1083_190025 [Xanthomonas citri pv. citri]CEE28631.1 hypothetical protein XAC3810_210025 [Xanthomonas citri pv. citri]CEE34751.1 hypothetical protein XAC908_300010 [Xanthomonas citri pv. citri]CEE58269.1 hypothetical protein XACW160_230026 [Xanthomonas citri pv. citri]